MKQVSTKPAIYEVQELIKGWGGFMKLHKYQDKHMRREASLPRNYVAQRKYDGIFVCAVYTAKGWKLFSRTGKLLYIPAQLGLCKSLPAKATAWYIGELIWPYRSLEQLSGLVNPNRTTPWSEADLEGALQNMRVVWHDCVELDENGVDRRPYRVRFSQVFHSTTRCINNIGMRKTLQEIYQYACESGWEGLVLKDCNAPYVMGKRVATQLKMVRQYTEDLECIDVVMGKGKRAGMIGALVFRSPDGEGTFHADFGVGWTDERRDMLTQQWLGGEFQHILGFWELTGLQPSSTGKAIRLPKVIRRRYDKDES